MRSRAELPSRTRIGLLPETSRVVGLDARICTWALPSWPCLESSSAMPTSSRSLANSAGTRNSMTSGAWTTRSAESTACPSGWRPKRPPGFKSLARVARSTGTASVRNCRCSKASGELTSFRFAPVASAWTSRASSLRLPASSSAIHSARIEPDGTVTMGDPPLLIFAISPW